MLEVMLVDDEIEPRVEILDGPRVRLIMSAGEELASALQRCRTELFHAVETSISMLLELESATGRVFVRTSNEFEVIATIDPTVIYGSQAIVRS